MLNIQILMIFVYFCYLIVLMCCLNEWLINKILSPNPKFWNFIFFYILTAIINTHTISTHTSVPICAHTFTRNNTLPRTHPKQVPKGIMFLQVGFSQFSLPTSKCKNCCSSLLCQSARIVWPCTVKPHLIVKIIN